MCMRTISDKWQYIYIYSDINAICKSNTYTYIDVFTILDVLIWIITFQFYLHFPSLFIYMMFIYTFCKIFFGIKNNTWMCGNMKFTSCVHQDISWGNKANEWDGRGQNHVWPLKFQLGGHGPFGPSQFPPLVIMQQQSFNRVSDMALKRL